MSPLLTVFTPSYNRAYTLTQLYDSLCRQTGDGFVWSIVDDGSSDNTEALVRQWIDEKKIPILYCKQPNGGKMRAHNRGVERCTTPLFVCIDSDDYVSDDFVEELTSVYWPQIERDPHLAGIIAYRTMRQKDGTFRVERPFPLKGTATLGRLYDSGFEGETTLVFKTEVLRQFPFLEVEGEKFSTEAYAYDRIDRLYEYLLVEKAWTYCTYLPDGYTYSLAPLYAKNPKGWALYFNQKAKFTKGREKVSYGILYMIFARRGGLRDIFRQSELKTVLYPVFWIMSYFYAWKWREKYPG